MLTIPQVNVQLVQRERNQKIYSVVQPNIGSVLTVLKNGQPERWVVTQISETGKVIRLYPIEKIVDNIIYYTRKRSWVLKVNSWGHWFPRGKWEMVIGERDEREVSEEKEKEGKGGEEGKGSEKGKGGSWVVYSKRTSLPNSVSSLPHLYIPRKSITTRPIIYRIN